MVQLAKLFGAVLTAAAVFDLGERLWSIQIHLDFRAFAELVGAILLVASIYIVRKDNAKQETARTNRYRASIEGRIEMMERWWKGEDQAYLFANRVVKPDSPKYTFDRE